jgi:ribosomal protein L33
MILRVQRYGERQTQKAYMAAKKGNRIMIRLQSTERGHSYYTKKTAKTIKAVLDYARFRWLVLRLVHCSLLNEIGGRHAV